MWIFYILSLAAVFLIGYSIAGHRNYRFRMENKNLLDEQEDLRLELVQMGNENRRMRAELVKPVIRKTFIPKEEQNGS